MADLDEIRRSNRLADVAWQMGIKLEKDGNEHLACCPFHQENTPSFTIFTGKDGVDRFNCFGCGAKGDVIDFVQQVKGVEWKDAILILGGEIKAGASVAPRQIEQRDAYAGIQPVPFSEHPFRVGRESQLYNPKRDRMSVIEPTGVYEYRDETGALWGLVLRRTMPDGGKETPTVQRVRMPDGRLVWSRFPFGPVRKLYGLQHLVDADQVILVEGEKCADAINSISGRTGASWSGGGQSWQRTDWAPLAGKDVILWADNDAPGSDVMYAIGERLLSLGCTVRIVDPHALGLDLPKGYDCADLFEASGAEGVIAFIRANISAFRPNLPPAPPPPPSNVTPLRPSSEPVQQQIVTEAVVVDIATRNEYQPDDAWMSRVIWKDKGGKPEPKVQANVDLYLLHHDNLRGTFLLDEALGRIVIQRRPFWVSADKPWTPREITDIDITKALGVLEQLDLRPTRLMVKAGIACAAEERKINSLHDELRSFVWDGVPRVEKFLATYAGVEDSAYADLASRKVLVQAVARAMDAGCKAELMLILEGAQNAGKSALCRALAGERWFTDQVRDIESKDTIQIMEGKWIIELAEMSPARQADSNKLKAFISSQTDRYRKPYAEAVTENKRQSVFIGTHNPDGVGYLKDPTGARRFLPVVCGNIDITALRRDRAQIWAEAMVMYDAGATWWLTDEEMHIVQGQQAERTERDPWMPFLHDATARRFDGEVVPLADLMIALSMPRERVTPQLSARVTRVMWQLGFEAINSGPEMGFMRRKKS